MAGRLWIMALVLALAVWCAPAGAQDGKTVQNLGDDKELKELGTKAQQLLKDGKRKEATDVAVAALAITEGRYGPDHALAAQAHTVLASLYTLQDQPEQAERHQQRAIAIFERLLAALTPEELKKAPDKPQPYQGSPAFNMALAFYFQGAPYYINLNRCAPALPLLERSVMWLEKAIGPDAYGPVEFGDRLVRCYIERGRYADAERYLKRAISIGERQADAAKGFLPEFRRMLAGLYEAQGHIEAAKALTGPAGTSVPPLVPRPHGPTTPANAQARAHAAQGRYAEAAALYRQELARFQDADSFAPTRAAIAALQGKLDEIAGWSAEARKSREPLQKELWGLWNALPTEERIAEARDALGALYDKMGRHAEAEALYRRELARLEAAFNPATKAAVDALQEKLKKMNRPPLAPLEERKALAKEYRRLSDTLSREDQIARAVLVLGQHYHQRGNYAEAEAHLKRAIALREYLHDGDEISLWLSMARLHTDQQRYADAETPYQQVLALYDRRDRRWNGNPNDPNPGILPRAPAAGVLKSLAALAMRQGQPERAVELYQRALKVLEDMGPDRFDVARALNDLAEVHRGQKRYSDAEPLLRRALTICAKGDMSPNHELVRSVLASLAALYTEQGRTEDAARIKRGVLDAGQRP